MKKRKKKDVDPWAKRPEYYAIVVDLLDCAAANYDHVNGVPASVVTIARKTVIEPLIFNMDDSRRLATKLLISLATHNDQFAQKVLDDLFPADHEGNFHWPEKPTDH